MRNKLQTKNDNNSIRDLVDVVVYTDHFLDADTGDPDFGPLIFDSEFQPFWWLAMEFDGEIVYDGDDANVYNSEIRLEAPDESYVALEHRFEDNRRDLLAVRTVLYPEDRWSFGLYGRYDNELGELEEQEYWISRKGECLSWALGVRELDGEITVWGQVGLAAVPATMLDLGR